MPSVTEESLTNMAQKIVDNFVSRGISLNDGVKTAADTSGFNKDQTSRLIERTNAEAFLRMYPGKTDFEVADPGVIMGDGVGQKTASYKQANAPGAPRSFKEAMKMTPDEIFGVGDAEKRASLASENESYVAKVAANYERVLTTQVQSTIEENLRRQKYAKQEKVLDASTKLYSLFKEAALRGGSTADLELDLVYALPERADVVTKVIDTMVSKLASETYRPVEAYPRAKAQDLDIYKVAADTELTLAFKELITAATAE